MSRLTKAFKSLSAALFTARHGRRSLENYCHRLDITDRLLALKDEFDRKGIAFAAE
jgi:hypothetical protein